LKLVTGQVSSATAARFAREAEIGARVHHRNLVSIVDVGVSDGGAPFLVMELVRGRSLSDYRDRFGDVAWSLPILRQIVSGLSALHDAGVVHRDLKPGNVLLEETGGVPSAKISDFGISRFGQLDDAAQVDADAPTFEAATPKKADLTGTGVIMGTPLYMAPEAAHGGRTLLAAADVFAFGVLAYEMLTGRTPFQTPAVLMSLAGQRLTDPEPVDAKVGAALRDLVLSCLAEDPKARPSSHRISEVLSSVPTSI
jgi:serine/threonine protein kinase